MKKKKEEKDANRCSEKREHKHKHGITLHDSNATAVSANLKIAMEQPSINAQVKTDSNQPREYGELFDSQNPKKEETSEIAEQFQHRIQQFKSHGTSPVSQAKRREELLRSQKQKPFSVCFRLFHCLDVRIKPLNILLDDISKNFCRQDKSVKRATNKTLNQKKIQQIERV